MLSAAILLAVAVIVARVERGATINPAGAARVADGDSLELGGERIRLLDIDAPELGQTCMRDGQSYPCGRLSRQALDRLVSGGPVSCEGWERDRYGRLLAHCRSGAVELNREQVAGGWAVAYGGYDAEEDEARAARRGIWAGEFQMPRDWRIQHGDASDMPDDMIGAALNFLRRLWPL